MLECNLYRCFQFIRRINFRNSFTPGRVCRLNNDRPREFIGIRKSIFLRSITFGFRHIESVICQKLSEPVLVLEYTHGFIWSGHWQSHLIGDVCCRNDSRIHSKRHYAVNLPLTCFSQNSFFVHYADIDIFVGVFMRDIIREIVTCYDVTSKFMSGFYNREEVTEAPKQHQFFL